MQPPDVNALFSRAEQAFVAGRLEEARRDLIQVRQSAGDHAAVLHLLALVEKKRGALDAAQEAFRRALAGAPSDPQINTNYGNLLGDLGDLKAALQHYERALAAAPGFDNARFNRALILQRLGRLDEALADLDAMAAAKPADARLQSARANLLRAQGRIDAAAAAYDEALKADPRRLVALHGRARVAMERGEPGASALYARALQLKPEDPELLVGLADALEAEGDPAGIAMLKDLVLRHPERISEHEALATKRAEAGEADDFADHYEASLRRRPGDRALHRSHWQTLAKAERHAEALHALQRAKPMLAIDDEMLFLEAVFTGDSGEPEKGIALLDRLDGSISALDFHFARGRMALRAGRPDQAARDLEAAVQASPDFVNSWAHLDLAWRLLDDRRHEWLSGQPGLYQARDLPISDAELAALAELLRGLHKTRAHPIGQSLRGGTQTRGRLFWRTEPEIRQLHAAVEEAVRDHVRALPARDDGHPLLRHREARLRIEGSWSVRLTAEGFHVNHIHPQGILSSACYISLPTGLGSAESRAGWLELGMPPADLGIDLGPLASVEPRPGRLALFPSYLFHGTRPFTGGERLTVAFDVAAR